MAGPPEMRERARPKLNLRLAVGAPGTDGYHPLASLMVEVDGLHDDVVVRAAGRRRVECAEAPGRANLVWAALDALEEEVGRPLPVAVTIVKRIPSRAGLGGGSSDAAAALRAADRLLGLDLGPERLRGVAARVGSDVPFFVAGGTAWATGRGERIAPASAPAFAAVLVRPPFGLSTAAVYARFDRVVPVPAPPRAGAVPPPWPALAGWVHNDLWPAALAADPGLGAPARALAAAGARRVLLCGSGSCLAGLVGDRDEAEAVMAALGAGGVAGGSVLGVVVPVAGGDRPPAGTTPQVRHSP